MPMLALTDSVCVRRRTIGCCIASSRRSATTSARVLGAGDALEQHGELVAAEPGRGVAGPQRSASRARDRGEQRVAGGVAEGVVDRLEVVEVEEAGRRAGRRCGRGRLDPLVNSAAVGQAGEDVVERLVAEAVLDVRHLGERAFEAAVLERDARVADERLEEPLVVRVERLASPERSPTTSSPNGPSSLRSAAISRPPRLREAR